VNELAARDVPLTRTRARVQDVHVFWVGTALAAAALAGVLGWFLRTWPPHEDETLALFVGRTSFGDAVHTVVAERAAADEERERFVLVGRPGAEKPAEDAGQRRRHFRSGGVILHLPDFPDGPLRVAYDRSIRSDDGDAGFESGPVLFSQRLP